MSTDPRGIRFGQPQPGIVSGGVIVQPPGGVSTSGPVTPVLTGAADTYTTLVEIQFDTGWEYFSFHGVGTPSKFYEPYILHIGSIERESPYTGGSYRVGDVDITFINYNQYFSKKKGGAAPGKFFYNRPVRILHGLTGNGLGQMTVVFTGRLTKWRLTEGGEFTITARDIAYDRFNSLVDTSMKLVEPSVFPNLPIGTEPRLVPVVYGDCDIDPTADLDTYDLGGPIPCYLIDDTSVWRYVVAQHVCKEVTTVFRYGERIISDDTDIEWRLSATPANDQFNAVCWSPSLLLFCAVTGTAGGGTGLVVMLSEDGDFWQTAPALSTARDWRGVCWSEDLQLFAAVGAVSGGSCVMTSPNGRTWTERTLVSGTTGLNNVIWVSELSKFVSIGAAGGSFYSTDGITWAPGSPPSADWNGIAWSPSLAKLVAVANSSIVGVSVATSTNGISWSGGAAINTSSVWTKVAWSPILNLFAAVAAQSTGTRIMTSPDGVTWTVRTPATSGGTLWRGLIWADGPDAFIAVGSGGIGVNTMVSYDGITWTPTASAGDFVWLGVAYGQEIGTLAAVNYTGTGFRAMAGNIRRFTVTTATYDGVEMTVIDFTYDPRSSSGGQELEITASVKGITDTGLSSGTLITNPVSILRHFLETYANCAASDIDDSSFTESITKTAAYSCGMPILQRDVPKADIINKWCTSFLGSFYVTRASTFGVYVSTSAVAVAPSGMFSQDTNLIERTFTIDSNEIPAAVIQYDWRQIWPRNFAANHDNFDVGTSVELSSLETGDLLSLWYVRDSTTSLAVATAYADLRREEVEFVSFDITPDQFSAVDLNVFASLVHWQGTGLAGYDGVIMRIFQVGMDLTPNDIRIRVKALKLKSGISTIERPVVSRMIRPLLPTSQIRPIAAVV